MEYIIVVCEHTAAAGGVAGTLKHHRVMAINMATGSTSATKLRKLRNGLDSAVKAMALILSILLSKLNTLVVRKSERDTVKRDSKI